MRLVYKYEVWGEYVIQAKTAIFIYIGTEKTYPK